MAAPNRRERLRSATVSEIKDGARRLLAGGGPQAVSLRAIARDMGMTAPAIYRYFPSLEALVGALAGDLFDEMRERVETARDAAGDDPLAQVAEMARAFRRWSVAHPAEYALIFGPPVPGIAEFADGCGTADHPGARFGAVFLRPMAELARNRPVRTPPRELLTDRLDPYLEPLRRSHGDLPVEVAYVFLTGWTRLHGLVSMAVFGQVQWAVTDPAALFETELVAFLHQFFPDPTGGADRPDPTGDHDPDPTGDHDRGTLPAGPVAH
ncbi:TetR/AcrR family transcriptional regulator [Micromonospora zhanjiangensis]|uniref:TetR/AcrR family transcriptional regulator n=1 Tax=Micromonospora zhanjiangensis TaxID=1522057 RepID=A0ABV8KH59_9ACTN